MSLHFSKYEGLGNDFIVVEHDLTEERAVALCDRHRGIGADGVLIISRTRSDGRDGQERDLGYRMLVINADGSVPEMCGNGIRCVAQHLVRTARAPMSSPRGSSRGETGFVIETDAGPHECHVLAGGMVEVMMRPASLAPSDIGLVGVPADRPLIDAPVDVGARSLLITAVSMGNPHVVTFEDLGEARLTLGPLLEKHPLFARGANAGFAKITGSNSLDLRVFERGAGWTEACGTGACAAAVAAVETSRAQRGQPLAVRLPGGVLTITVFEQGSRVCMTGPARHVFDGVVSA